METDTSIQKKDREGEDATDASECHQLRQRVERLKMEVIELKAEAKGAEVDHGRQEKVAKSYKAKNAKLIKELNCNKETQLHLETQMREMEEEQAHNYHLETQVQKMEEERAQLMDQVERADEKADRALEEQKKELESEMRSYVDAASETGLADCERLVEDMETLTQEYESRIESMEDKLRQAQAETRALQENEENKADHVANKGAEIDMQNFSITAAEERIKELTDEIAAQITQREAAECALLKERSAMREEGETADAEIRELLEKAEELDREKQSRTEELREKQRMHDTVVVENANLGVEKESISKELQTLREESSDKLKKKNDSLLEKMDKLKESNETEQEKMSKQKIDMKVEIKELHETVKKMEAEIEEQKVEYLKERGVQEQELIEAEAEISTMALSAKFEQDFKKLMEVLKQIAVGKGKQSGQEKPESQILNALEWYTGNTEALEAMARQNHRLRHDKLRLTRACVRQDVTETEGDGWDMTFKMVVGETEMARMSAEGVDKIRHHDEELKRARTELHTRIKTNVNIIRRLQGNACVVRNKTRGDVSTMLQQAEQEATTVLTKQLANKNKNSVSKQVPSKIAELALIDSNKMMRQMEEVVMNQQKEKIAPRIATEARSAAEARTAGKGAGSEGGTEGEAAEDEDKLEAMRQELAKLKAELETSKQELALKVEEQEMAEQEGWINKKAKFSEVAAQTKEEAERKAMNTEFSRELKEARAKLRGAENELAETETQLQKARVSWNETTGKEKEKLRAEILELKQATTRPKDLESVDTKGRMKEMASLVTKLEESKAEAERLTAMQAEHEMKRKELQDRLEEQASEAFTCKAETRELQDNNKELQKINEKLQGLKEEDQSTTSSVKELKETQKQLKQMLEKKTT